MKVKRPQEGEVLDVHYGNGMPVKMVFLNTSSFNKNILECEYDGEERSVMLFVNNGYPAWQDVTE